MILAMCSRRGKSECVVAGSCLYLHTYHRHTENCRHESTLQRNIPDPLQNLHTIADFEILHGYKIGSKEVCVNS